MLIDPHVHSSGVSPCSRRSPEKLIAEYIADKMDGFVLTNHCDKNWMERLKFESYKDYCQAHVDEYEKTKALGEKYGIKVFFGVEVTALYNVAIHYLIYGISPEELLDSPILFTLSQEELYNYCKENGYALIQAHPYRNGATPQNPKFMDGVEINCAPNYKVTMEKELREFAAENDLRLICGSDYHGDTYKPRQCGIYIPDTVSDEKQLRDFILSTQPELNIFDIIVVE